MRYNWKKSTIWTFSLAQSLFSISFFHTLFAFVCFSVWVRETSGQKIHSEILWTSNVCMYDIIWLTRTSIREITLNLLMWIAVNKWKRIWCGNHTNKLCIMQAKVFSIYFTHTPRIIVITLTYLQGACILVSVCDSAQWENKIENRKKAHKQQQ